jgi:hypothetical protein
VGQTPSRPVRHGLLIARSAWTSASPNISPNDAIQINKALFASAIDLLNHTTDSASGAIIAASATDQITLVGVTKAQLMAHQADFYFA